MVDNLSDVITLVQFLEEIIRGYDFTRGHFPIFLLTFARALQQCSATVLPIIVGATNEDFCDRFQNLNLPLRTPEPTPITLIV